MVGTAARLPLAHAGQPSVQPFGLLRLATACDAQGHPNRHVCEQLFEHVWGEGLEAADPQRQAVLQERLAPSRDPNSDEVKSQLREATQAAIDAGVFGVPSIAVDDKLFWGQDALPMLRDYLTAGPWFQGPDWDNCSGLPKTMERKRS